MLFGGVYLWCGIGLTACTLILWMSVPGRVATSRALRTVDLGLIGALVGIAVQLIPLPISVVRALSPSREAFLHATSLASMDASFATLTLNVADSVHAATTLLSVALTFWIARSLFSGGGIRTFAILIAWGAVVLSIAAFVQHASGTPLVYGFWHPRDPGARPLGPFINRNHFGTWGIMTLCLCVGYLEWRQDRRPGPATWRSRLAGWMDGRGLVLQLAVGLIAALIAVGGSRSALLALVAAAGYVAVAPARARQVRRGFWPVLIAGVLATAAMLFYGDAQRLLLRLDETRENGIGSRAAIWRDAMPVMRDFAVTGVGAGAFGTAMRVYQTTPRTYYHNEAHNQYVQLLAEGGLLLTAPVLVGVIAFLIVARERLSRRTEPLYWMRVASAGALFGVAIQSLWETGLTLPANGMFAAALAGLLVHESSTGTVVDGHSQDRG